MIQISAGVSATVSGVSVTSAHASHALESSPQRASASAEPTAAQTPASPTKLRVRANLTAAERTIYSSASSAAASASSSSSSAASAAARTSGCAMSSAATRTCTRASSPARARANRGAGARGLVGARIREHERELLVRDRRDAVTRFTRAREVDEPLLHRPSAAREEVRGARLLRPRERVSLLRRLEHVIAFEHVIAKALARRVDEDALVREVQPEPARHHRAARIFANLALERDHVRVRNEALAREAFDQDAVLTDRDRLRAEPHERDHHQEKDEEPRGKAERGQQHRGRERAAQHHRARRERRQRRAEARPAFARIEAERAHEAPRIVECEHADARGIRI